MTLSIAGQCSRTGMLGVAVTTSSICVGSRCPRVRAGVGAVSSQNVTLPSIGPMVLDRIAAGESACESVASVTASRPQSEFRQVTAIDNRGRTAHFSGARTLGTHGTQEGEQCVAAGNLLRSTGLAETMVRSFGRRPGAHLAERLLGALESGLYEAGGEVVRYTPRACSLPIRMTGPWWICGSNGTMTTRSCACVRSGSATSRRLAIT